LFHQFLWSIYCNLHCISCNNYWVSNLDITIFQPWSNSTSFGCFSKFMLIWLSIAREISVIDILRLLSLAQIGKSILYILFFSFWMNLPKCFVSIFLSFLSYSIPQSVVVSLILLTSIVLLWYGLQILWMTYILNSRSNKSRFVKYVFNNGL
jgi:hypothetical protein